MLLVVAPNCRASELRLCDVSDSRITIFITDTKGYGQETSRVLSDGVNADPSGDQAFDNFVKQSMMEGASPKLRLERKDLSSGVTVSARKTGGRTAFSSLRGSANYLMAAALCVNEMLYANPDQPPPRLISQPCKWRRVEIDAACLRASDLQSLADAIFSNDFALGLNMRVISDFTDTFIPAYEAATHPSRKLVLSPFPAQK